MGRLWILLKLPKLLLIVYELISPKIFHPLINHRDVANKRLFTCFEIDRIILN